MSMVVASGMTGRAAFEAIGRDAARGYAVDMWKVADREGRPFLVISTHKGPARTVYEITGRV